MYLIFYNGESQDGEKYASNILPVYADGRIHRIEVVMGKSEHRKRNNLGYNYGWGHTLHISSCTHPFVSNAEVSSKTKVKN